VENYALPKTEAARRELAAAMGAEGRQLLAAIEATTERRWIQELPAVQTLRQV
jgi:hypothetical protein